eukprot:s5033_g10.t1
MCYLFETRFACCQSVPESLGPLVLVRNDDSQVDFTCVTEPSRKCFAPWQRLQYSTHLAQAGDWEGLDDSSWRPDTSLETLQSQKQQRNGDRNGMVQVIV